MTTKVKLSGIIWDTDGQQIDLPKEMVVEVEREPDDTDEEVFDMAIDAASDKMGWLIGGIGDNEILPNTVE